MQVNLPSDRELRRRVLSLQPFTHGHVWLWATIGVGLPVLAIISVLGLVNGWNHPWPQLVFELPVSGVAFNGTVRSIWLHKLPRNASGA